VITIILLSLGLFFSCASAEILNNGTDLDMAPETQKQTSAGVSRASLTTFHVGWFESRFAGERTEEIASEGGTIVVPYVGSKGDAKAIETYLDSAAAAGLKVALQIPGDFVRSGNTEAIGDWVFQFRDHRAVELWYLFDEPEIHGVKPQTLKTVYRYLKGEGRGLKVAMTFYNPRKAQRDYAGSFDVFWLNYYPVMWGTKEFFGISIGNFAGRVRAGKRAAATCGAEFGMIVQAYGTSDKGENQFNRRLPSAAELRYMIWASLKENPSYLLFWSRYRSDQEWLRTVFKPTVDPILELFAPGTRILTTKGFSITGGAFDLFHFCTEERGILAVIGGPTTLRNAALKFPRSLRASALLIPWGVGARKAEDNTWILEMPAFGVALFEIYKES